MSARSPFDRGIIIPLGIGLISIIGIGLILMKVRSDSSKLAPPISPTATPFKYLFLATETLTPEFTTEANSKKRPATETQLPLDALSTKTVKTSETPRAAGSQEPTADPNKTETPTAIPPNLLTVGKYDDIDDRITYDGDWFGESVDFTFGETLFVSNSIGDSASLKFLGTQLELGYLEDPELGVATVTIDETEYTVDQASGAEWLSPILPFGEHSVTILHTDGEVIILDYVTVVGAP